MLVLYFLPHYADLAAIVTTSTSYYLEYFIQDKLVFKGDTIDSTTVK